MWGKLTVTLLLAVVGLGALAPVASVGRSKGPAVMSCGEPGSIEYLSHPRSCSYTFDGSEAHRVSLYDLKWKSWGARRARASGMSKDIHDQDRDGFQSHHVRVVVYGLRKGYGTNRAYYLKMKVSGIRIYGYPYIPLTGGS